MIWIPCNLRVLTLWQVSEGWLEGNRSYSKIGYSQDIQAGDVQALRQVLHIDFGALNHPNMPQRGQSYVMDDKVNT